MMYILKYEVNEKRYIKLKHQIFEYKNGLFPVTYKLYKFSDLLVIYKLYK